MLKYVAGGLVATIETAAAELRPRNTLGDDERRVHQQVDDLLNREEALIVLVDGDRTVSYSQGFGVSACQLELLTLWMVEAHAQDAPGREKHADEPPSAVDASRARSLRASPALP